jgi:hypothetical protein
LSGASGRFSVMCPGGGCDAWHAPETWPEWSPVAQWRLLVLAPPPLRSFILHSCTPPPLRPAQGTFWQTGTIRVFPKTPTSPPPASADMLGWRLAGPMARRQEREKAGVLVGKESIRRTWEPWQRRGMQAAGGEARLMSRPGGTGGPCRRVAECGMGEARVHWEGGRGQGKDVRRLILGGECDDDCDWAAISAAGRRWSGGRSRPRAGSRSASSPRELSSARPESMESKTPSFSVPRFRFPPFRSLVSGRAPGTDVPNWGRGLRGRADPQWEGGG